MHQSCDLFDQSNELEGSQVSEITGETGFSLQTAVHLAAEAGYIDCLNHLMG